MATGRGRLGGALVARAHLAGAATGRARLDGALGIIGQVALAGVARGRARLAAVLSTDTPTPSFALYDQARDRLLRYIDPDSSSLDLELLELTPGAWTLGLSRISDSGCESERSLIALRVGDDPQFFEGIQPIREQIKQGFLEALAEHEARRGEAADEPSPQPPAGTDEADDEPLAPALTESDRLTLNALASFDPSILASAATVSEAMPMAQRVSERTVRESIKKLVTLGLAERPEGNRQGARLTIRGRRLASQLGD